MDGVITTQPVDIKSLILTIRGIQVLLDSDVAMLYGYETKYINQTANRNKDRFPDDFRFQLTKSEFDSLESLRSHFVTSKVDTEAEDPILRLQNVTSKSERRGGRRYMPYVYTEQGIAMLSGLLKNTVAIQVSIGIMQAFVEMRRFISAYGKAFERISTVEYKLIEYDRKFDELFDLIQTPKEFNQGIFYKGQIYDAFKLIMDIVRAANKTITIIDNYTDDSVLDMLTKKKKGVAATIITAKPGRITKLAVDRFKAQYPDLQIVKSENYHDRFIIIDDDKLYHVGASLKDAGKKCFAISLLTSDDFLKTLTQA
jgi:hypothetical protein